MLNNKILLEPGTRVKIRKDLKVGKYTTCYVTEEMVKRAGMEVMILQRNVSGDGIYYTISGNKSCYWIPELFEEEIALQAGETIKIRPDLKRGNTYGGMVFDACSIISDTDCPKIKTVSLDTDTGIIMYTLDLDPELFWTQDMFTSSSGLNEECELIAKANCKAPLLNDLRLDVWRCYYSPDSENQTIKVRVKTQEGSVTLTKDFMTRPDSDSINLVIAQAMENCYAKYIQRHMNI